MEIKTKINKWGLMKLKIFCTAKEIINKTKRQPSEWEKIFANDATDKGLIFKINSSYNSISKKESILLKYRQRISIVIFSKEDIQMANRPMKRCQHY